MKLRTPGTLSAAINEIKRKLTEEKCAELVERSESLIRKWADPDDPALPNLRQSLLLDVAYMQAGFGEPPIQSWYMDRLDGIMSDAPRDTTSIVLSTLHAQSALGQVALTVAQFTERDSDRGDKLSPNERAVVLGMVENLSAELDKLEGALQDKMDLPGPIALSKLPVK
jgi:hypothetical protein